MIIHTGAHTRILQTVDSAHQPVVSPSLEEKKSMMRKTNPGHCIKNFTVGRMIVVLKIAEERVRCNATSCFGALCSFIYSKYHKNICSARLHEER